MIRVKCPKCGKALKAEDKFAGKPGKCPRCGKVFTASSKPAPRHDS